MNTRRMKVALLVTLISTGCSDREPTGVSSSVEDPSFARKTSGSGLLTGVPVTGALPGGGTFEGLLSVTQLTVQNGQLLVSGTLTGTATQLGIVTQITQTFTNIVLGLTGSGAPGACQILNLDLGPIFLDLLGLQVDLSEVNLDLIAQSGPGKLLGNLLCAVVGLLDAGGPIDGLLHQINRLLAGLLG